MRPSVRSAESGDSHCKDEPDGGVGGPVVRTASLMFEMWRKDMTRNCMNLDHVKLKSNEISMWSEMGSETRATEQHVTFRVGLK